MSVPGVENIFPRVRFGVSFRPDSPADVIEWCRLAESLGYARLGISDSVALYREPWVILGAVAQQTVDVPLGVWMTNSLIRHPAVTASAAATLDELAPGRACIGIATGNAGVYNLGHKPSSTQSLRHYVECVRSLLEHGEAWYDGRRAILPWARRRIPIYLAAHGTKAIRLAGQIGDGVVMGLGITPDVVQRCLDVLREGAEEAGRSVDDIDVWWLSHWEVDERPEVAKEEVAGLVAGNALLLSRFTMEGKFVPDEHKAGIERLGSAYDSSTHGKADEQTAHEYARIARRMGVADYLIQRFAIAGTPAECRAQIRKAVQAGARQFMTSLAGPDRPLRLRRWHDLVMGRCWDPAGGSCG